MTRHREPKPRITDADARPAKTLTSEDIERHQAEFFARGGQIQTPDFRRDALRKLANRQGIRRAWVKTPPDLKPNLKGKTRER